MARKGRIIRITKATFSDDDKEFTENPIEGTKTEATRQIKPKKKGDKNHEK
jgi:hypothetical protein